MATRRRAGYPPIPTDMPSTRFGRPEWSILGGVTYGNMNWVGIAQFESNKVADWIKFMIRHDRYELGPVLNGVVQTLITLPIQDPKSPIPASAGNAYLKTGVPMLLLELVCDPAMYARFSPSGYRHINVAIVCLTVIHRCIGILARNGGQYDDLITQMVSLYERFWRTIWAHRTLFPRGKKYGELCQGYEQVDLEQFALNMYFLLSMYSALYSHKTKRYPPLSTHAAHCAVYFWVYGTKFARSCQALELADSMICHDTTNFVTFVESVLSACGKEFPSHFADRTYSYLHDDRVVDGIAASLISVLVRFIRVSPATFCGPDILNGVGLVPYLMLACRRQICSSTQRSDAHEYVVTSLEILHHLTQVPGDDNHTHTRYSRNFSLINFMAAIAFSIVAALEDISGYGAAEPVLSMMLMWLMIARESARDARRTYDPAYPGMAHTTARIWHDSLKEISAARVKDQSQLHSKKRSIEAWKTFGDVFDLKEGVNMTSLRNPSWPSDEKKYWKIPRQCFYGPCICSLPLSYDRHFHALRVCKGCYRVLYCNARCQALDWKAGHSLECGPYRSEE